MKRVISILLVALMVLTASSALLSCKKEINTGTEAAKLLLANERLDSKVLSKIDLGIDGSTVTNLSSGTPMKLENESEYMRLSDSLGVHYTWKEFEQHSHSMVEFTQFMNTIELKVESVASDIERMKSRVGVTDKWVESGIVANEEHMLCVYENMDMLLIKKLKHNALYVCTRYTNENAKNVYEIFSFYKYDDGDSARMRLVYIPGERYEWSSQHANGFGDYFIAENSRGYWVATRYSVSDESSATFWPLIIKDGLGYGGTVSFENVRQLPDYDRGEAEKSNGMQIGSYSIFDPVSNRELFRIEEGPTYASVYLYFTAIKSGFVSVSTDSASYDAEEKVYSTGILNKLVTSKGEYNNAEGSTEQGKFYFAGGYVQHYYGDNFDCGNIEFKINLEEGKDLSDYILGFKDYVNSIGMEIYCDMNTVKDSLYHARLFCHEFDSAFEWNGIKMSSYENAMNARQMFIDSTDTAISYYEEVKDYPTVDVKQRLSKDAKFADIDSIAMGENSYSNGVVTLSGISVSISDVALFEQGTEYMLKIGLSLCDESGNPISVNTVALSGTDGKLTSYSGGAITLTSGGSYNIPKNLSQGKYVLVAYASTKDGIRVSEMKKISFINISEGNLDSSAMDIEISKIEGEFLQADYQIKNSHYIEMKPARDSYSYDEIRRAIMQEILAYGCPDSDATLQYENGDEVPLGATLGRGVYRMIGYMPTSDGLAQAYVYLTVSE